MQCYHGNQYTTIIQVIPPPKSFNFESFNSNFTFEVINDSVLNWIIFSNQGISTIKELGHGITQLNAIFFVIKRISKQKLMV